MANKYPLHTYHRFLDEAGDDTFYRKNKIPIIGQNGVSYAFMLGMITFREPLQPIRDKIIKAQKKIEQSEYYKSVPSVMKRITKGGYYFHAKDDLPEIKKEFFDCIQTIDCSLNVVVGRKIVSLFEGKHHSKKAEFYADLLSHLIEDDSLNSPRLVLNIAERPNSTAIMNLEMGLQQAKNRLQLKHPKPNKETKVTFNVRKYTDEPLLAVADALCWSVQRVFEKGEVRFYKYMSGKIPSVLDLYDNQGGEKGTYYTPTFPLTSKNKISPQTP